MPTITTHNSRYSSPEVENLVTSLACALEQLRLGDKPIALQVDISLNSIALVLAVIKLGLKVAFCPLREPTWVIKSWLAELNIKILICSLDFAISDNQLKIFNISELRSSNLNYNIIDQSHNFLSYIRTSGTTSVPKSAVISFMAHYNSAWSVCNYFNFGKLHIWALSLPLYHVSGLSIIFRALIKDAEIYIAPDHESLVRGLVSGAISHCSVVPAQVKRLLDENVDLSKIKALIVGGDSLRPADRDEALLREWPLYESYGMCETASMIAVKNSKDFKAKTTILSHADIKITLDQEILVKASSLFSGYWSEGKLSQNLSYDGYFATGDMATCQNISQLELINRKNNRIISGGENIQAEEVERALEEHAQILLCVVVPIADDKMGARPLAFVKWRDEPVIREELYDFLAPRLAHYKWPLDFLDYPKDTPQGLKKPRQWFQSKAQSLSYLYRKNIS